MTSDFDPQKPVQNGEPQAERQIVDLIFDTLRQFRQEMAPRLAVDGMFVSTREPLPRGTPVRFRFVLPEEFVLAHGDAFVAWRRTRATHPDLEPGMALWFQDVEQRSRDIIQELVSIQESLGEVFDTRRPANEVGEFVANEFAGSFATSFDLPALTSPEETKEPAAPETVMVPVAPEVPEAPVTRVAPVATEAPVAPVAPEAPVVDSQKRAEAPVAGDPPPGRSSEEEESPNIDRNSVGDSSPHVTRAFAAPEPAAGGEEGFEVSLMADDSEPDVTPLSETAGSMTDLSVVMDDAEETPEKRRLWPLAGLAVVFLAAVAAVVWWLVIRPQEPPVQEVHQSEEAEQPAAVLLLDDSDPEPATEPLEVVEPDPQTTMATADIEPATRVVDVDVARLGDTTVIGIRGNGDFDDTRLQVSMLKDPPRVLVRIAGIETFYRPNEIEVGSPEVVKVRVGHHPEVTPVKLYVVIDLAEESMAIRGTSVAGDTIRIVVGRE